MIIRNGKLLAADGFVDADVRVEGERIAEVDASLAGGDGVDASGLFVLPGIVDTHVHFNEPGREYWEGFASGSAALASGGGTCFVDMPLNAAPPTIDRESFQAKRAAGEALSMLDFALWGGLVPGNLDRLEELAECGVVGFKAFMIDSGTNDFPGIDPRSLRTGMAIAARLGLPVAVHAEDAGMIAERTAAIRAAGGKDARAWCASRSVDAEVEAVRVALDVAGETGCALHVVHVSSPQAIERIRAGRSAGIDVTCEVCPHHVLLAEGAMAGHGAFAKCAPPLRSEETRGELWRQVLNGQVDCVGSDHSPAPPEMKTGDDFFEMWGGIMGCQHGFLLLLDAVLESEPDRLPDIWAMMTSRPADRFGIGTRKGRITPGFDADLILVDRRDVRTITSDELLYRHRTSPYVGMRIRSRVVRSFLRGRELGLQPAGGRFLSR